MRPTSWRRLTLPLLLALSVIVGLVPVSVAPDTLRQSQLATPADDSDSANAEIMLANYAGGHTINKEIRESEPRADGYYHVDTDRTIAELKKLNANTHYFLMWHSPSDWTDFTEEFLPAAQKAGIDVWAYIVPPSECHSTGWCSLPFKTDYLAWAKNIAQLSVEYDHLKGWVIDDFTNGSNGETFTTEYMKEITEAAAKINPDLKLETVAYYGKGAVDDDFYEKYSPFIDGIVFPYRDEPNHNTLSSSTLPQQLDKVISHTKKYKLKTNLLLYTGRYGTFATPTPDYVADALAIGLDYARQGKIHGIVSYGTPHRNAPAVSSENEAMYGNGRLALAAFAGKPDPGDYGAASQTIKIDPAAERATLNFWIRNRFFGKQETGQRFAEVLVNDEVVWSADIVKSYSGDRDGRWRQSEGPIEIDRSLFDANNTATLTFRVRQEVSASVHTETSFDNVQASGLQMVNGDFESPGDWELESTYGAFIPRVEIWQADRPTRVFNTVAKGFQTL